jgi:esterase
MQLHFRQLGQGEPLILLHGLFGSSDNWLGVASKLAQNFHLFFLDLRNHGQSPHSDETGFSLMAADVAEFMDAQKLERANVLGHSLGGKTAMQLALDFPSRVEKLIVVDIALRAYSPSEHEKIFKALLALDLKKFQTRTQIEEALAPELPDLALRRFLLKNLKSSPAPQQSGDGAPSASFTWKMNLGGLFKNYQKIYEPIIPKAPFTNPALFLRGGRSRYVSEADILEIKKMFPRAKIETIARAGHWVHADAPEEFVAIISSFLAGNH